MTSKLKIVWFGDFVQESGFGRICNEVGLRLALRGHQISGVSLLWDGIFTQDWYTPLNHPYPFHVSGVAGRDWGMYVKNIVGMANPDVVISTQDFPYAQQIYYNMMLDWSRRAFVNITPIDGYPIEKDWLTLTDETDATMVISEFGVEAMRQAGRKVGLCPPGIDASVFKPATPQEKKELRAKLGLDENAFILGMMAMNQGRKAIPHTLDGFAEFSKDKPNAYLYLDMDKIGQFHIPHLLEDKKINPNKVIFKDDAVAKGLSELRDRYCILDAHSVLSHREGFGLPLIESQACRVPTIAQDWCSGTEVCGGGKGYLVKALPQPRSSTWGGALDKDPDVSDFVKTLNQIYLNPESAKSVAQKGYEYALTRTWDKAADAVEQVLLQVAEKRNHAG